MGQRGFRKDISLSFINWLFIQIKIASKGNTDMSHDGRYWMLLLALMTGARISELKQLNLSDIVREEDIYFINVCFDFDEEDERELRSLHNLTDKDMQKSQK